MKKILFTLVFTLFYLPLCGFSQSDIHTPNKSEPAAFKLAKVYFLPDWSDKGMSFDGTDEKPCTEVCPQKTEYDCASGQTETYTNSCGLACSRCVECYGCEAKGYTLANCPANASCLNDCCNNLYKLVSCDNGYVSDGNSCRKETCSDNPDICGDNQKCSNGECVDKSCDEDQSVCSSSETCVKGECVTKDCNNTSGMCTSTEKCQLQNGVYKCVCSPKCVDATGCETYGTPIANGCGGTCKVCLDLTPGAKQVKTCEELIALTQSSYSGKIAVMNAIDCDKNTVTLKSGQILTGIGYYGLEDSEKDKTSSIRFGDVAVGITGDISTISDLTIKSTGSSTAGSLIKKGAGNMTLNNIDLSSSSSAEITGLDLTDQNINVTITGINNGRAVNNNKFKFVNGTSGRTSEGYNDGDYSNLTLKNDAKLTISNFSSFAIKYTDVTLNSGAELNVRHIGNAIGDDAWYEGTLTLDNATVNMITEGGSAIQSIAIDLNNKSKMNLYGGPDTFSITRLFSNNLNIRDGSQLNIKCVNECYIDNTGYIHIYDGELYALARNPNFLYMEEAVSKAVIEDRSAFYNSYVKAVQGATIITSDGTFKASSSMSSSIMMNGSTPTSPFYKSSSTVATMPEWFNTLFCTGFFEEVCPTGSNNTCAAHGYSDSAISGQCCSGVSTLTGLRCYSCKECPPSSGDLGPMACEVCKYYTLGLTEKCTGAINDDQLMQCGEALCRTLPNEIMPVCFELHEAYKEPIIQLLNYGYDPTQICLMIKLCE